MCPTVDSSRNARQAKFRETPLGKQRAQERNEQRKATRRARRLEYQQQKRSAVVGCVALDARHRRDVGLTKDTGE